MVTFLRIKVCCLLFLALLLWVLQMMHILKPFVINRGFRKIRTWKMHENPGNGNNNNINSNYNTAINTTTNSAIPLIKIYCAICLLNPAICCTYATCEVFIVFLFLRLLSYSTYTYTHTHVCTHSLIPYPSYISITDLTLCMAIPTFYPMQYSLLFDIPF